MRRRQDYNISKIQLRVPNFGNTFVHDTEIRWSKLHPYFFKFIAFLIKNDIQKLPK
jgi:hypothetical protein